MAQNKAYDAVSSGKRRRNLSVNLNHEDRLLKDFDRDSLASNLRHVRRNAAVPAWAMRTHLNHVSTYSFQCRSQEEELNRTVESFVRGWSLPQNCDISGRYSLEQLIRMGEACALTDGDYLYYKIADGHIQIIEGDRIRTPTELGKYQGTKITVVEDGVEKTRDLKTTDFINGIRTDQYGRPIQYALCDRGEYGGFVIREIVEANHVIHDGYFDRYDQLRGVSPVAAALNTFFDIHEASEYALNKAKLSQLLGIKFKRNEVSDARTGDETNDYDFDFSNGGVASVELFDGDDVEFLESTNPSDQFQSFLMKSIQVALKALDIPYSFYAEDYTNYSGARQALLQYEASCKSKQDRKRLVLTELTIWRLGLYLQDGQLSLPEGMTIDDLRMCFDWIPPGMPWIDPVREVTAAAMAVKSGFKSRQMICKDAGDDFFSIVDQIAAENRYLSDNGLSTDIDNVTLMAAIQSIAESDESNPPDKLNNEPDTNDSRQPNRKKK